MIASSELSPGDGGGESPCPPGGVARAGVGAAGGATEPWAIAASALDACAIAACAMAIWAIAASGGRLGVSNRAGGGAVGSGSAIEGAIEGAIGLCGVAFAFGTPVLERLYYGSASQGSGLSALEQANKALGV